MTPDVLRHRPQVVTALESKWTSVELTCRQTGNKMSRESIILVMTNTETMLPSVALKRNFKPSVKKMTVTRKQRILILLTLKIRNMLHLGNYYMVSFFSI